MRGGKQKLEYVDDPVGLRSGAIVGQDGAQQVSRSAIVQEKCSLSKAPQRSRTKFIRPGIALTDIIGKPDSHIVNGKIREQVSLLVVERSDRG